MAQRQMPSAFIGSGCEGDSQSCGLDGRAIDDETRWLSSSFEEPSLGIRNTWNTNYHLIISNHSMLAYRCLLMFLVISERVLDSANATWSECMPQFFSEAKSSAISGPVSETLKLS